MGEKTLSSYKDFDAFTRLLDLPYRYGWIAYKNNNPIGFVDLEVNDRVGHFSFYLSPEERGHGLSKGLLLKLVNTAQEMSLEKLVAGIEENNIPSQKAVISAGFILSGKDEHDYLLFELVL